MKEVVAYCGLVCSECPTYKATKKNDKEAKAKIAEEWSRLLQKPFKAEDINCNGCLAVGKRLIGYCLACEVRKCCVDKHILNCGYCEQCPCDKLNVIYAMAPPEAKAKSKLEVMRNTK